MATPTINGEQSRTVWSIRLVAYGGRRFPAGLSEYAAATDDEQPS
ncbi:hypothetical protein [Candidatus Korobacter versatilis]|nr:hypothetical protein [Candidatus Koribacter versatilis]